MESLTTNTDVRLTVTRCFRTLKSSTDSSDIITALRTLHSYLDEGPDSTATSAERAEFRRAHYSSALQLLVSNIQADWLHQLTAAQRAELWDGLFLAGPPEQALLVLMDAIGELRWVKFLQRGRLAELLWSYCLEAAPSDSPQLRETLLGRISALPDITANKLQLNNRALFRPQQYYPLLATEMLTALEHTCQALRAGTDCNLTFVAQTLGKVCIQGHSGLVLAVMAPRLSACTRSDMVWQRVCWKLLENVPQRWMESVLTGLVQAISGPDALGRIIGNLVLTNKKAQFVITHKLLLLQYKYEVLQIILGYLAADRDRRPLLIQVLRSVSQAWSNSSAVKHTPLEQQLYVSKALLLSVSLLKDSEIQELRSELLQCMLGGMQTHLDSNVVRIRHMGMVIGEYLSSRMDINGTKLKFEVRLIYSRSKYNKPPRGSLSLFVLDCESIYKSARLTFYHSSDDELTPYDMSGDQEISKASPPRYLRDCLEILISSEDPVRVELALKAAESLVRKNSFAAREISVQMSKVLLHMDDKYNINGFLYLRQATMVALTVTDCIPVAHYLTTEFYSLNYSLRQRLDILEVLALAAQELSKPVTEKKAATISSATTAESTPYPGDNPVHWQQVVEKRIQSKTKRLTKKAVQPVTKATPNRYAPNICLIHDTFLLAAQMGCALLDFVWAVRYHADQMVRRGVLFAVCSVFLSMPSQNLLVDIGDQLFETRSWLADVAEGDPDADCRSLAVQSLVLLDKSLKKQLQDPQAPTVET
uniref:Telomere length regulation protein TEL2 homolog n=1 Tax=Neolamprologus brichardi TaxID=32507 RepID=A0A3Q4IFA8_NEOBR